MEQLINAATPYNYAMLAFLFFGVGSICFGIIIFIVSAMAAGKELLIITGLHFGNICNKYDDQITAIIKPVISESYPNATDFFYCVDEGSFTENDIEYKIQYKKTIKNEDKLIISVKKQSGDNKDKQIKTLNVKIMSLKLIINKRLKGENDGTVN